VLRPSCPASARRIRNGCLLCSSLYGQNPQYAQTILGWKCIGNGAHHPYHPTQGEQAGYIIGGGPHIPGIGGPTGKYGADDNLVDNDPDL
jgi:hypothetical protein